MEKIDQITGHPLFRLSMEKIEELEEDRVFCCHGMGHSLDVARMAHILNLERGLNLDKEMIYAAALLHDLGRWKQYTEQIPHHRASETLAAEILGHTDFDRGQQAQILRAIRSHRRFGETEGDLLADVICEADKKSRNCWCCKASRECYWPEAARNRGIEL